MRKSRVAFLVGGAVCLALFFSSCDFSFGGSGSEGEPAWANYLRKDSPWYKALGYKYIELAFKAAREADPDAKLYYNDYSLNNPIKAQAVHDMVADINARYPNVGGRPLIDGIGMQSHHHIGTDPATVEASIKLFESLGVKITISELDIQTYVGSSAGGSNPDFTPPSNQAQAFEAQARQYAAMFKIFKAHKNSIERVTFWGIDDPSSWKASSNPLLFDKDLKAKEAVVAVQNPDAVSFGDEAVVGKSWDELDPLSEVYKDYFLFGNIVSPRDLGGQRFNLLKKHFNTLTAENDMKPDSTQRTKGRFTYQDYLVNAAIAAGLKMHGHCLVWHSQTPSWMNSESLSSDEVLDNMVTHVKTVVAHYKGKLISWDVVNEAVADQ